MGFYGAFLLIVGLIYTLIKAIIRGYMSIEIAGLILAFSILFLAVSTKSSTKFLKFAIFIIPIWLFMKEFDLDLNSMIELFLIEIVPLLLMLYGLYLMLKGPFVKK